MQTLLLVLRRFEPGSQLLDLPLNRRTAAGQVSEAPLGLAQTLL